MQNDKLRAEFDARFTDRVNALFPSADKPISETERREIGQMMKTQGEKDQFKRIVDMAAACHDVVEQKIKNGSPRSLWSNTLKMDAEREAKDLRELKRQVENANERELHGRPRYPQPAPRR